MPALLPHCLMQNKRRPRFLPALRPLVLRTAGYFRRLRWHMKRRMRSVQPDPFTPDMLPLSLEGYTDQLHYQPGQTVQFYLKALQPNNQLLLQRKASATTWEAVSTYYFDECPQPETFEEAQTGCAWSVGWRYPLLPDAPQGYYRALLSNTTQQIAAEIHFLVGNFAKSRVAVLAPVTTWLAYNTYGGQSLYRNALSTEPVSFVSALRPNPALSYARTAPQQHDLLIESTIYNWFSHYYHADLLPDYSLEAHPEKFEQYDVIVLAYHAEYFSEQMYTTLRQLIGQQKKSLLALGGNQCYWQVRWHQNFTRLECRKNSSFFENEAKRGGLWRHTPEPEAGLLGVQFTETGMGTYAPYQVTAPRHWLFEGSEAKMGQLFGEKGVGNLPICGDETDKTAGSTPSTTIVLARGLNKAGTAQMDIYKATAPEWNGAGGGEIVLTELSPTHGVLSTGSIQSGAGLGVDTLFTLLILNFMRRYARISTESTNAAETAVVPGVA